MKSSIIIKKSAEMLKKSFEKTFYTFKDLPELKVKAPFGIYVNIPLCKHFCTFCPFYKVLFTNELKDSYLSALLKDIRESILPKDAGWLYFGGGTPNVLSINELQKIVQEIKNKVIVKDMGIELHPDLLTTDYLIGLKNLGFNKISIGIESFSKVVNGNYQRKDIKIEKLEKLISYAISEKIFVNTDIMVGLKNQDYKSFMNDIEALIKLNPSQITIYPYMVLRNMKADSDIPEAEQFQLIEKAWAKLKLNAYTRKNIWCFSKDEDYYDTSRQELTGDYVGFGAASFSTYNQAKIVKPEIETYIKLFEGTERKALIAPKDPASDIWRDFASMIYDLKLTKTQHFPTFIKILLAILKISGYIKKGQFTAKGIIYSHHITKKVVESLPYPLQNTHKIVNYDEYKNFNNQILKNE